MQTNWFKKLFIDEAKPALNRHSGGGSGNSGGETVSSFKRIADHIGCMTFQNLFELIDAPAGEWISYDDTSNATTAYRMFYCCKALTTIPLFNTANVTDMQSMFYECRTLTNVPLFNTAKVTTMHTMFYQCYALIAVPLFNTANVTDMQSMFYYCEALTTVPLFNTANVTTMATMFYYCYALTTVPLFNTAKVNNMRGMFNGCRALTTVPELNMINVTDASKMFANCNALTECWLRNISSDLQVSNGTSWGHLLTLESLIHLIKECRNVGGSHTLTVGSANLEKLADVYVKLIDITDEMRAEDEFIDQKLPFEVCESTDEGAMTIFDYAAGKNWSIK